MSYPAGAAFLFKFLSLSLSHSLSRSLSLTIVSRIAVPPRTRKGERGMIYESIRVYSNLPKLVHDLPEYKFVEYTKKHYINTEKNQT